MILKNAYKHLKTITTHKWYVFLACCRAGIVWRGLVHDLSKFSPTEFLTNIKYYEDGRSPINVAKEKNGYSIAWQHHRGRNPHHYEYWVDNLDMGGKPIPMPYTYAVEMICDYIGAGKAYIGKKWTISDPLNYWYRVRRVAKIHPLTSEFITYILTDFSQRGIDAIKKDNLKFHYDRIHSEKDHHTDK